MDKTPSLNKLMRFGSEKVDIIAGIGQSYYKFGINILEDDGSKMAPLDSQHRGDAERINTAVLTKWIRGEGRKPTSWVTLATVLDECNLSPLADEIRSVKGGGSGPHGGGLRPRRGLLFLVTCDYQPGTPNVPALPATNTDGMEMKKTFEQQFGYKVFPLSNAAATEQAIKSQRDEICRSQKQHGDVIVFAFSGHGTNYDQLLTNDHKLLSLRKDIVDPILNHSKPEVIKLFFVDACRGNDELTAKAFGKSVDDAPKSAEDYKKGFVSLEENFRIEYATIPDHVSYAGRYESKWMPRLARKLREVDDTLQNISADVKQEVHETDSRQQCETVVDRVNGRLYLNAK
jgi:hypothetical protein